MIQAILEFILTAVLRFLVVLIAIPITWIAATPYLLIRARNQPGAYWENVRAGYKRIARWFLGSLISDSLDPD